VFNPFRKDDAHPLDETIASLITDLGYLDVTDEDYALAVTHLKSLCELRMAEKAAARSSSLSPDMIAGIAANLLAIGLILSFEKANVITTKSLSFVPKIKS
jgi:hypothetical protein